jgi:hypothetical protein
MPLISHVRFPMSEISPDLQELWFFLVGIVELNVKP